MSRNKRVGTAWESAVVDYLRSASRPHVERRALGGARDRGDIAGLPGWVIEAKSCGRIELAQWIDEAETERHNDGAAYGVVWAKRRGKRSPGAGYVVMSGETFARLLDALEGR